MTDPTATSISILSFGLICRCIWKSIIYYNVIGMLLAAIVATRQEAKIWSRQNKSSDLIPLNYIGYIKVFLFNLCWYIGCLFGSIYICIKYIITLGKSNIGYDANHTVEAIVANFVIKAFVGKVEIEGYEHLHSLLASSSSPLLIPAPIFVANHCSQLDIGAIYRIFHGDTSSNTDRLIQNMQFKWIAKHSVLYLPGVGPLMYLGDHVLIYRRPSSSSVSSSTALSSKTSNNNSNNNSTHKASVTQLFIKSNEALQNGIAMFLFPQGTRRMTRGTATATNAANNDNDNDTHLPFKDGAFIMAEDNNSPLIPITIIIPRNNSCWNSWYPFNFNTTTPTIRLVIHKPVLATTQRSKEELKQLCYSAIYSVNFNTNNDSSASTETAKNK